MGTKSIFPTKIYEGKLRAPLNGKLLACIGDFSAEDRMGKKWSEENYPNGYTSYASLSDLHRRYPAFQELETLLQSHAEKFSKKLNWERKGLSLQMTHCWANIMKAGAHHTLHLHPHSVLSGTYYVSVPKDSAPLKIEDPRMSFFMNAPLSKEPLYHLVKPANSAFVIFESWLRHEVPPQSGKTPRISISFNYAFETDET